VADFPAPLQHAIQLVSRMPGIGKRSAERIVLALLTKPEGETQALAQALTDARQKIKYCKQCAFYTESDLCAICTDASRDPTLVCIVEYPQDILSIEKSNAYRGLYHSLMGRISPLDNVHAEDLRIASLLERLRLNKPSEVILALSGDVEGEATAVYLAQLLKEQHVQVSRIAHGISAGLGLEHADTLSLHRALEGRRTL